MGSSFYKDTMKRYLYYYFFIIYFTYPSFLSGQNITDYGLRFFSHEVNKDLRTSLNIHPGPQVAKGFTLSFTMHLIENREKFGYIFRLVADDKEAIDLISNSHPTFGHSLTLVEGNKPTAIFFELAKSPEIKKGSWVDVRATFEPLTHKVSIAINGEKLTDTLFLTNFSNIRLCFGANEYGKFSTSDVPPIEIRDLKIYDYNKKLLRHWEFRQHLGNIVYDQVEKQPLTVQNPIWLIDEHTRWRKRAVFYTALHPQITFRSDSASVLAVTSDTLYSYSLERAVLAKKKYRRGTIFPVHNNQVIFHPFYKELWQYDLRKNRIARYNFLTNSWDNGDQVAKEPQFWHHNKFISPRDSSLFIFGGYGNFTYKNLLQRFDQTKNKWDTIPAAGSIKPRYLSASGPGVNLSEILIFGGYGNGSGKQELSPQKLYDLYSLDLTNNTFTKRWEMEGKEENFVVANSLVLNKEDSSFYALCFPIHKYASFLYLRKFSLASPENSITGDSIPYFFHDTKSYGDLFYSEATRELVAVTCFPSAENLTEITVYTIAYPAISRQAAMQLTAATPNSKNYKWLYILLPAATILAILLIAGNRKRKKSVETKPEISKEPILVVPVKQNTKSNDINVAEAVSQPAINLLGGLQVIDKNGINITSNFTPALKQLLVMLTLYTSKNGKGISSVQLKNLLWPDKTEESARNNRGVSIKKIRTLLAELGNASVINESNHWLLALDENIFCDFSFLQQAITGVARLSAKESIPFIEVASKGGLLPDMENEWLDSFKSDYASRMIDAMLILADNIEIKSDPTTLITISEVIFLQDPLNETALKIKCKELFKLGKYTVAKSVYSSFISEYGATLGADYKLTFEEVIS